MYDNTILAEFDFVIDLDLAMFLYIKANNPDLLKREYLRETDEKEIIKALLSRVHINPFEILLNDDVDENTRIDLYERFMNDSHGMLDLLNYAKAYDTFGLMVAYLKQASSVDVEILCFNQYQVDFIHSLNPNIKTILYTTRRDVPLEKYTILYVKYFTYLMAYQNVRGKHIYIPSARFNMDETHNCLDLRLSRLYGDLNEIRMIDMYRSVKWRIEY